MPNANTSIKTTLGAVVKSSPGTVYWLLLSCGDTGGLMQMNDSIDDSGTDLFNTNVPADSMRFYNFSRAPISFKTGIFADIPGLNIIATVGYA